MLEIRAIGLLKDAMLIAVVAYPVIGLSALLWAWVIQVGDTRVVITSVVSSGAFLLVAQYLFYRNARRSLSQSKVL